MKNIPGNSGAIADQGFCSLSASLIGIFLVVLLISAVQPGIGQNAVPITNHSEIQNEKNLTFSDFPGSMGTSYQSISDEPDPAVTPQQESVSRVNLSVTPRDSGSSEADTSLVPPPDFDASFNTSRYLLKINNSATYEMSGEILSLNCTRAPMIIAYRVTPLNITDVKWFSPRDAQKKIDTAVVNRPYEYAWFKVRMVNSDTGAVELQQGWARPYATPSGYQEFILYTPGNFRIELSGCYVTVHFMAFEKKPDS